MSWRGEEGGITAAKENHDVIMTPGTYCYLDHSQSKNEDSITIGGYLPLEKVYGYEPIPPVLNAEQAKHVLGAQGNVWTEYMKNEKKVEYMIFPRMTALAEVLWSPKEKRNWKDFERRLPGTFRQYNLWGANYSNAFSDLQTTILPTNNYNGILLNLETKNKEGNIIYIKGPTRNATFNYTKPILITTSGEYGAALTRKDHTFISNWSWQKISFNKATGKKITIVNPPSASYPGNGTFTLVDGVQNEKGLSKSGEFLGFNGTDLDATIDLGKITDIKKVTLHVLEQPGSWIYLPVKVEITYLQSLDLPKDGTAERAKVNSINIEQGKGLSVIQTTGQQSCRYIHVIAKNSGIISQGNAGAGNPAWLFVDEIEVE